MDAERRAGQDGMFVINDLGQVVELVGMVPTLYVRYSPGPEADAQHPSVDHESGLVMPGYSVNPLTPPKWWIRPVEDWAARRICQYQRELEEGSRPWVLTGEVIDHGPDNEPLLGNVSPIAWLSEELVDQARRIYRSRFHAGKATHTGS
jgi:hypothetical protein